MPPSNDVSNCSSLTLMLVCWLGPLGTHGVSLRLFWKGVAWRECKPKARCSANSVDVVLEGLRNILASFVIKSTACRPSQLNWATGIVHNKCDIFDVQTPLRNICCNEDVAALTVISHDKSSPAAEYVSFRRPVLKSCKVLSRCRCSSIPSFSTCTTKQASNLLGKH